MEHYPMVKLKRLDKLQSLAFALNLGVSSASGEYYLFLNPDVVLDPNAIAYMLASAQQDRDCAAVAAKLRFIWAPKFLNGLGNYVGALSGGADSALGHLDLGQFDVWEEVPSACFATALVPAGAWKTIGPIDEGFPLYYEDTEWCYRARLFGFSVRAAPQAIAYHAFSGRVPTGKEIDLTTTKRRQVVYGRLRFVTRILSKKYLLRFLFNYLIEDLLRACLAFLSGRWRTLPPYFHAWNDYRKSIPSLRWERREIQARRRLSDKDLFALQRVVPIPLMRYGLPQLTWDLIRNHYYPLLASGQTRPFPEYSELLQSGSPEMSNLDIQPTWKRAILIFSQEGFGALLHRVGKAIQWRLLQP
jgi:GT2 family glycosyltransferase